MGAAAFVTGGDFFAGAFFAEAFVAGVFFAGAFFAGAFLAGALVGDSPAGAAVVGLGASWGIACRESGVASPVTGAGVGGAGATGSTPVEAGDDIGA